MSINFNSAVKGIMRSVIAGEEIEPEMIHECAFYADRLVLFEVYENEQGIPFCKLSGGIPYDQHLIGLDEELKNHPDLEAVYQKVFSGNGESESILEIENPRDNPLTSYFREIIENTGIKKIIYLPLVRRMSSGQKKLVGIIVIDVCDISLTQEKRCALIALKNFFSLVLSRDDIVFSTDPQKHNWILSAKTGRDLQSA